MTRHHAAGAAGGAQVARVRIGLCGFTVAMRAYARDFPVVEVQGTFYDPPTDATMLRWRGATGPDLEYTMKAWQLVTHPAASPTYRRMKRHEVRADDEPGFFRDSPGVSRGWRRSVECAGVLGATAILFQCPASFRPDHDNLARMRRFFERIERPAARLLWEPRGRAWNERRGTALALCRDLGLVHVVDPFVTAPPRRHDVYWRLHGPGSARASYDDEALRRLAGMLAEVESPGAPYVLFNNLPRVGDARRFAALLRVGG
jgi:uncharacterized protein YecE (DUF72 family)